MLGQMDWLGLVHFFSANLALASGLVVVARKKGSKLHKRVGWVYFASMIGVNATAFMIYDLWGRLGPFHLAAMVSGVTVILGIIPALRRKPRPAWVAHHAYWMSWSYVGLAAAAAAEISTRYLHVRFWWSVGGATLAVVAVGYLVINNNLPRILSGFGIKIGSYAEKQTT